MEKSKSREKEIFEALVESKVGEIRKYRNLINALIACYSYFNSKERYKCYLGSQIGELSPDLVVKAKQDKRDILGDGKKGLAAPPKKEDTETWDEYHSRQDVKNYMDKILEDINNGIKKYMVTMENISEPHDFFLLSPTEKRTAIKLLQKQRKLDEKSIILSYDFTQEETKYILRIVKEFGTFTDEDIDNDFEINGIMHLMQDSAELMSRYKLYIAEKEDYNAPIEWIMLVIWQYIIPEVAKTNNKDMIIAKLNNGYFSIEISLKQISDFIKGNYKLPTFNGEKELISFGVIKKAMDNIALLTDVKVISSANSLDTKYRVIWSKLPTYNLLHEFVKKVHGKEFEKTAKEEANKAETPKENDKQKSLKKYVNK